ncbi:MAG: protein NO VEIN domain-containing protein [Acidobacteriaceae bacterium]
MRNQVEGDAIEYVVNYYSKRGCAVRNVTRVRGDHKGYDLLIVKGNERYTVEVKGCSRPYGIPDPYYTEFDPDTLRLVADLLCVVYFHPDREPELAIIPRDAIPPAFVKAKITYVISGKFKNERTIRRFIVQ